MVGIGKNRTTITVSIDRRLAERLTEYAAEINALDEGTAADFGYRLAPHGHRVRQSAIVERAIEREIASTFATKRKK